MKKTICRLALAGTLPLVAAMTFDELKREVAAAEDGATVYVENDMEVTGVLPCPGRVTIASPAGQTNTLLRAAGHPGMFVTLSDAASQLTLRDVVVDWNKAAGQAAHFATLSAGSLTLDAGAEVRNCRLPPSGIGGIHLSGTGRLVMNDGAVIRGFEGDNYATAVLVGMNVPGPVFEMNGGLITDCVDRHAATASYGGYGGAVYVYGGNFIMHGGAITGNVSEHNVGGVVSWSGKWYLSGSAVVTNNVGEVANDAWVQNGYISFDGDYDGRMTMRGQYEGMPDSCNGSQWAAYIVTASGKVAGTGNVSSQRNPERIMNGVNAWVDKDGVVNLNWGDRIASVGPGRYDTTNLTDAFNHARPGETVMLTRESITTGNWEFNGSNYNGLTDVTLSGRRDGTTTVIHRQEPWWNLFSVGNMTLRLEHLVLDGEPGEAENAASILRTTAGGHLVLGPGCVLRNGRHAEQCPGISVAGSGATLVMEDGAVVRDCTTTGAESWATAIRVGYRDPVDVKPRFEMRGGLVTNCVSLSTKAAGDGYGGAVYIQNAEFVMSGGAIVGNTSPVEGKAAAGLIVYDGGGVTFTGTARIENNFGGAHDVYRTEGGSIRMAGDFRGRVGISSGDQAYDHQAGVRCEAGSTGAWNFFSAGTDPYGQFAGYNWSSEYFGGANDQVYWGRAAGTIDDARFSSYERFNMAKYLPSTFDLDTEAPLPHVLGGTACALGGEVTLTTADADALKARMPLALLQAADGAALTGAWTFTVPAETGTGVGKWIVRTRRSSAGVVAYELDWTKSGVTIVVR